MKKLPVLLTVLLALGTLSNPALAAVMDIQNFGVYQDTNASLELDLGDTFLGGFMNWFTYYSAATSYNYHDHDDAALDGFTDLPGAPYAADEENDQTLRWLPISDESEDDVLHLYMVWSYHDNNSAEGELYDRSGFGLGIIANSYITGRSDDDPGGAFDLDIAIRNDDSSLPQVTLSDDYDNDPLDAVDPDGRPPHPGYWDNATQELWKVAGPDPYPLDPYDHYFQGSWEYTKSTTDGGIIGGIHNDEYDIGINLSDMVTAMSGDGLLIRIDPQGFEEVSKIIIYDFGYAPGADQANPVELVIAEGSLSTDPDQTFFIASIPGSGPDCLPGDVNCDGWVSGTDLSIILTYWGQSGLGRDFGDLDGSGMVDGPDYTEVLTYWGTGTVPPEPSGIPEPATLGLLLIGGLAVLRRSRSG